MFVAVFDRHGFLTVFRPDRILFSAHQEELEGIKVPMQLKISQQKSFASIEITGITRSFIATPVDVNKSLYFIQSKLYYTVLLEIDGKKISFPASGNAETFVRKEEGE